MAEQIGERSEKFCVVGKIGTDWAFEATDTLETTAQIPGDSTIVPSYL